MSCTTNDDFKETSNLNVCISDTFYEITENIFSDFTQAYPDVDLVVTTFSEKEAQDKQMKLRTELMSGNGADVYLCDDIEAKYIAQDIEKCIRSGAFCDLNPLLKAVDIDKNNYIEPVLKAGEVYGKQFIFLLSYETPLIMFTQKSRETFGTEENNSNTITILKSLVNDTEQSRKINIALGGEISFFLSPYWFSSEPLLNYQDNIISVNTEFINAFFSIANKGYTEICQDSNGQRMATQYLTEISDDVKNSPYLYMLDFIPYNLYARVLAREIKDNGISH